MVITKNCSPQIVLGVINKINLYIKELLSATITKEEEEMLITIMVWFLTPMIDRKCFVIFSS